MVKIAENKPDVNDYLIWWVTERDYDIIDELLKLGNVKWPKYLMSEYESRRGRAGRGRLWSGVNVDLPDMTVSDGDPVMKQIVEIDAGGIVIRRCHMLSVWSFPGFITDFSAKPFIATTSMTTKVGSDLTE